MQSLNGINGDKIKVTSQNEESSISSSDLSLVSFLTEIPIPIKEAMTKFIEAHPNWDQYRLIKAALSGFLVQNGIESRSINRIYYQNMFSKKSISKII